MSETPAKRARTEDVKECRACLMKVYDDACCVDIFRGWHPAWSGMGVSIAEDLAKLTNIVINVSDPLPKSICKRCCFKLQEAVKFTMSVQNNDTVLRERYKDSVDENLLWPKPIQVDKNITSNELNEMTVEVKQEVLTEDEYESNELTNESYNELGEPSLDIKIEPEEITPAITVEVNGPYALQPEALDAKENGVIESLEEMPREKKLAWSPRKMRLAVEEAKSGAQLRKTAFNFGIPVMSLYDHVKKGSEPRLGGKPVFNMEQEAEIRDQLIKLSNTFYGLAPIALRRAVYRYAEKNKIKHPFNTQTEEAGKDWFYSFLKRNPELSVRMPDTISVKKISALQHEMKIYFKNLLNIFEKHSIPPNRIYNVDETGVTTFINPIKTIAPKGQKQVGAATGWERGSNVTVCCCMSAIGHFIPPMFIFPGIRMPPVLETGGPPGSVYACSKSGCMMDYLFLDWLKHFVAYTKPSLEDVVLLILDNDSSHISLAIYDFCRENGVLMLSLPPNTSYRTQPLDLTFFGPLKLQYHRECDLFRKMTSFEKITPHDIALLLSKAYLKTANAEKAVNGFAAAGIWPVEPGKFVDMYGPTETTDDAVEPMPSTNVTTQMPTRDFGELNQSQSTSAIIPSSKSTRDAPDSPIPSTSGVLPPSRPTEIFVHLADCSPAPTPRKIASDDGNDFGKGNGKGRK